MVKHYFFLLHISFSVFLATLLMDIVDLAAAKRWYLEPERVMLLTRTHPCFRGCSVKPTEGTVFSDFLNSYLERLLLSFLLKITLISVLIILFSPLVCQQNYKRCLQKKFSCFYYISFSLSFFLQYLPLHFANITFKSFTSIGRKSIVSINRFLQLSILQISNIFYVCTSISIVFS